jgi:hypothetical protein
MFVAPSLEVTDQMSCSRGLRLDEGLMVLLGRGVDGLEMSICAGAPGAIECFDEQGALKASYNVIPHVGTSRITVAGVVVARLRVRGVLGEGWLSRLDVHAP